MALPGLWNSAKVGLSCDAGQGNPHAAGSIAGKMAAITRPAGIMLASNEGET
jgi:hypothetical protein